VTYECKAEFMGIQLLVVSSVVKEPDSEQFDAYSEVVLRLNRRASLEFELV
jgi:hypothetical protein